MCWGTRECWSCKAAGVAAVGEPTIEGNKRRRGKFFGFYILLANFFLKKKKKGG